MEIDKGKIKKWVKQDLLVQQGDVDRAIELAISKTISEFVRMVDIPEEVLKDLRHFLLNREYDIAEDWEDFGILEDVFRFFIGRKPRKYLKEVSESENKQQEG